MDAKTVLRYGAIVSVVATLLMGLYLADVSEAVSYASKDSKACINCHVMESYYATWQHSSHAERAECVDCHLPAEGFVAKYAAKARDGWNHSVAFTLDTYGKNIRIKADGSRRVRENCVSCHQSFATTRMSVATNAHDFSDASLLERDCWDCHRDIPHGGVRSIDATPYNLGVKWARK